MKLQNATYLEDEGLRPILLVFIDGLPARIIYEQKFLHRDVVFLGGAWEDRTEEIEIPAEPKKDLQAITVKGFVKDARLAQMVRDFRAACDDGTFAPGPAEIPQEE